MKHDLIHLSGMLKDNKGAKSIELHNDKKLMPIFLFLILI